MSIAFKERFRNLEITITKAMVVNSFRPKADLSSRLSGHSHYDYDYDSLEVSRFESENLYTIVIMIVINDVAIEIFRAGFTFQWGPMNVLLF